ncbi:Gfo/Idh/MocA family protein [Deinococcus sp. UYEF24]
MNWGILGTSFISDVMAQAISKDPGARVCAVAGRNSATLASFQKKFSVPRTYLDYDELIADPEVDAVYIALPNHLHHDSVVRAAAAGKHILCEKSLSLDMEKTDLALEAVRQAGVFFMEGLMYLAHPFTQHIAEVLRSGELGRVRTVSGGYCAAISQFVNPQSGGAIFNLGCYPASLLHLVVQASGGGELAQIQALGEVSATDGNICDSAATLRFSGGLLGRLHCAETYGAEVAEFSVVGELGALRLLSNPWLPGASGNRLEVSVYGQPPQLTEVNAKDDAYLYQVKLVRQSIEAGLLEAPWPAPGLQDSRRIMEILTRWETAAQASLV